MRPSLSIVIPAYNEQSRLPSTLVHLKDIAVSESFPWDLKRVLVVNDGSKDGTRELLESWAKKWPLLRPLHFSMNLGKGAAVFAGLDSLSPDKNDWLLIADADEATPWSQLLPLAESVQKNSDAFLIFGSRRHLQSRIEHRQVWWREKMGRIFNILLRTLTGLPFKDTQCGFKLIKTGNDLENILNRWTVARFAWDAELILHAVGSGFKCVEQPIEWRHVDESRVHPVFDGLQMAGEILRIRCLGLKNRLLRKQSFGSEKAQTDFRQNVKSVIIQ